MTFSRRFHECAIVMCVTSSSQPLPVLGSREIFHAQMRFQKAFSASECGLATLFGAASSGGRRRRRALPPYFCLWRSPDLGMVSVVVVVVVVVLLLLLLVGATFALSDLCTIQKNL